MDPGPPLLEIARRTSPIATKKAMGSSEIPGIGSKEVKNAVLTIAPAYLGP
jgi:hypothetical protein